MENVMTVVLIAVISVAIYSDLSSSRIPNWLTFAAMGFGFAGHTYSEGIRGAILSLAGLALVLGPFFILYVFGSMGAGDVKLMAAVGSMLGPFGALSVAALSVLVGGLYALGAMGYQWGLAATSKKLAFVTYGAFMIGGTTGVGDLQLPFRLRYALAIAAGTLLFLAGVQPFGG